VAVTGVSVLNVRSMKEGIALTCGGAETDSDVVICAAADSHAQAAISRITNVVIFTLPPGSHESISH